MLYPASSKGPLKLPGIHDAETSRLFGVRLKPDTWIAETVYLKEDDNNQDVVIPTTFSGLYYKVKSPGISGATEPTWVTVPGEETIDGETGLIWEAVLYTLMPVAETITAVTVTPTGGVTVTGIVFTDASVDWMIQPLASDAEARTLGYFDILVHVTKSNGETIDATIRFKLGSR